MKSEFITSINHSLSCKWPHLQDVSWILDVPNELQLTIYNYFLIQEVKLIESLKRNTWKFFSYLMCLYCYISKIVWNDLLLLNWTTHHQWAHQKQQTHLRQQLLIEFLFSLPHFYRILETSRREYFL